MLFANDDKGGEAAAPEEEPLKVLIVDDETEVHKVTELTLKRFRFNGRKIKFLHAYSGEEAQQIFRDNPRIALALVDVVMETDHAGLDLIHFVRNDLDNSLCRLILRTGQPGQAPEHDIIERYDINDYKEKTELTSQKLKTLMYAGLRSFVDIETIESHKAGLKHILASVSKVLKSNSLTEFSSVALKETMDFLKIDSDAVFYSNAQASRDFNQGAILAATGAMRDCTTMADIPDRIQPIMERAYQGQENISEDNQYVFYTRSDRDNECLLYLDATQELTESQQELLGIYCINISLTYDKLKLSEELVETQEEFVQLLVSAVIKKNKETINHIKRVSTLAYEVSKLYGLCDLDALRIKAAAPLHDFGEITLPDDLLLKPGALTDEEREVMKTHTEAGHQILSKSTKPTLLTAAEICLSHHERWDGGGYPNGWAGEDIPVSARIVSIADVFDALASKRAYKESWDKDDIKAEFVKEKGGQFEPKLVDAIVENFDALWSARGHYLDPEA
ncbi:DUF3369 domain-containing protein [Halioxenophilus aromaticivorans]